MNSEVSFKSILPDDIIIDIFNYVNLTMNIIVVFPWLSKYVPKCEDCGVDSACFKVKFNHVAEKCYTCYRYNKGYPTEYKYICRSDCDGMYGSLDDFKIDEKYNITASYMCEDECNHCGTFMAYDIDITGTQIQRLSPRPTNKEMVYKFIEDCLVKNKDKKILKSAMVKQYKYYNGRASRKNNGTKQIFDKKFDHNEEYYLYYQFIDETADGVFMINDIQITNKDMIQKFIKKRLVKNNDRKILKSVMIEQYKKYNKTAPKRDRESKKLFDNEIENDKEYYLYYQFADEIMSDDSD